LGKAKEERYDSAIHAESSISKGYYETQKINRK
jgi:hypothetical protein